METEKKQGVLGEDEVSGGCRWTPPPSPLCSRDGDEGLGTSPETSRNEAYGITFSILVSTRKEGKGEYPSKSWSTKNHHRR